MAGLRTNLASRHLRTLFNVGTVAGLSDSQLLERFLTRNGEAAELAFSALVERHGAMVLRVCRRILTDPNDAHDAFQATFLVLVRRASTIQSRESLASWLHGVALRVATSARSASLQRAVRERQFIRVESSSNRDDFESKETSLALHEEIDRLPERFREPIVLCDLQEITHEQAAEQLGCPVGTIKSRLARGRDRLRSRLIRRGLAPAAIGLILEAEVNAGAFVMSAVSRSLFSSTAAAAMEFASGRDGLGLFRASAAYLAQGVLKMIRFQVWMRRTAVLCAIAMGGMTLGLGGLKGQEPRPLKPTAELAKAQDEDRQMSFQIAILEMDGLKWREKVADRLELLEQVESQTIWTLGSSKDADEIRSLAAVMTMAPKVTTFHRATAFVQVEEALNYVSSVKTIHDGDHGVAFMPKVQELKHGGKLEVSGTIKPDGILTKAIVRDRHLVGIETSTITAHPKDNSQNIAGTYQIPQLVKSEISGEWFVPNNGALVISLGTHTETGRFGFSKTRERLVVIEPRLIDLTTIKVELRKIDDLIKTGFVLPNPRP